MFLKKGGYQEGGDERRGAHTPFRIMDISLSYSTDFSISTNTSTIWRL